MAEIDVEKLLSQLTLGEKVALVAGTMASLSISEVTC